MAATVTLTARRPATLPELAALSSAAAPIKPIDFKVMVVQHARSETESFYAGDDLLAAACYYPLDPVNPGERHIEVAFVCRPALSRHMLGFIRLVHLTRSRLAQSGPVRVRAHVRASHRPGQRLAVLCGMVRVGSSGAFDRYEWMGAPDVGICRGVEIAVHRA